MQLEFSKVFVAGRDILIIDLIRQYAQLDGLAVSQLAQRMQGIGAEQVLLIEAPSLPEADLSCRLFDQQGAEVDDVLVAVHCAALFAQQQQLVYGSTVVVQTSQAVTPVEIGQNGWVRSPISAQLLIEQQPYHLEQQSYILHHVESHDMAHDALLVDKLFSEESNQLAQAIHVAQEKNLSLVQVVKPNHLQIRHFLNGQGEVYYSEAGAVAGVLAALETHQVHFPVQVEFAAGRILFEMHPAKKELWLATPIYPIFTGQCEIKTAAY